MLSDLENDAKNKMSSTVAIFKKEIQGIRGGRVQASLLDSIQVRVYGGYTKLPHLASVSVVDDRSLSIKTWDKSNNAAVKDALSNSELGVTPSSVGDFLMITLPALTAETRARFVKMLKTAAENALVALRNIRRDSLSKVKSLSNGGEISEDDYKSFQNSIQKILDSYVIDVEKSVSDKEKLIESV